MQESLTSFHASSSSTSSSGRLDNHCANTSSLLPPSKPVREVTREYIRSGQSVESSSTSSSLQKDISWNQRRIRRPSTESTEALPGDLPVSDSIRRQPIITSSSSNNNTKWEASLLLRAQPSTQTRSSSDATSLVISKPVIHAPNLFFGKSQTKKSLLDEEDDEHSALWAHSIQFMNNDADGNVSDLEDEDEEPIIIITDDSNRWSNSSNNILDRILSSSEFSMPSKPQRRVSVAHKV